MIPIVIVISVAILIFINTKLSKRQRSHLEGVEIICLVLGLVGIILFAILLPMMLISIKSDRITINVLERQIALKQMNNDGKVKVELNGQTVTLDADKILDLHQYKKLDLKLRREKNIGDIEKTKIHILIWFGIPL